MLASLAIRHIGASNAELIAEHFGDIDAILNATSEQIQEIDGIGPEAAASLRNWLDSPAGLDVITALRLRWRQSDAAARRPAGQRPIHRQDGRGDRRLGEVQAGGDRGTHQAAWGKVASSVSKKTDYLIVGADAGSKLDKAQAQVSKP